MSDLGTRRYPVDALVEGLLWHRLEESAERPPAVGKADDRVRLGEASEAAPPVYVILGPGHQPRDGRRHVEAIALVRDLDEGTEIGDDDFDGDLLVGVQFVAVLERIADGLLERRQ